MSNRIVVIQGTDKTVDVDLYDENGNVLSPQRLLGAIATFLLRTVPTDIVNLLSYSSVDMPSRLVVDADDASLLLAIPAADSNTLALGPYFYQLRLKLTDGATFDVIPWAPFEKTLGGSATPAPPVFTNTTSINQDYPLPNDMTYMTPGGSPIMDAQVRVYLKSDYDVGRLASPVGITTTDASGKWRQAVLVTPGYTYVARLEKLNEYGPDKVEFFA